MGLASKHLGYDREDAGEETDFLEHHSDDQLENLCGGDGYSEEEKQVERGCDMEMEDLENEYRVLHQEEINILKNLRSYKDEDLLKGQAVKNQKALWDKTLELRFLLQKSFTSSNRLPKGHVKSMFCSAEGVDVAYSHLIASSRETLYSLQVLQEALIEKNPHIVQAADGKLKQVSECSGDFNEGVADKEWLRVSQSQLRIASFRDKSVDKWQRKTQVTSGANAISGKLHAFNQNISEQVAAYMRDPCRMIKNMQQRNSVVSVFGSGSAMDNDLKGGLDGDNGDPELLDDSEFYQQLLKELFEAIDPTTSDAAFYALKRLQTRKRNAVDRRASKSRKIRYDVHEKIVNFMAPEPMNLPDMAPKLFGDLFGLRTRKPTSV